MTSYRAPNSLTWAPTMALPQPPVPQVATCYRHPDREAGRRCTRCGKWACSECLVQASVGSHCVDCARAERPNVTTRARYWNARQPTLITYALIALNLASERVSFSAVIDRTPGLRQLDRLGRRPPD